jgi:phosphinothricin acetyltransferase
MSGRILIRAGGVDDVDAVTRIYSHSVLGSTASFEVQPPDRQEMLRRREAIVGLGLPYLIAEIGGEVAGYAYASQFRTRWAYRRTVENSVYVGHSFHRLGVGRMLMLQLMKSCASASITEMVAVVGDPAVNSASVRLHRSLGFEEVGVFRGIGEKFGKKLDVMMLQRSLSVVSDGPE